jgi:hypothetical protein
VPVAKKWYSYFVVTDEDGSAAEAYERASTQASAPVRASDLAPESASVPTAPPAGARPSDLDEVYAAARIDAPPHGYSVLKVAEMLASEHISALAPDVKRKSVMVALDAAGVKVTDIVEDAVRRDRALDTYERVLQKHLDELRAQTEAENKQLEDEIQRQVSDLRARIDANAKKVAAEESELQAWRTRKHQEEDLIAHAVGYFVSENPITTSTRPGPDVAKGDADVR